MHDRWRGRPAAGRPGADNTSEWEKTLRQYEDSLSVPSVWDAFADFDFYFVIGGTEVHAIELDGRVNFSYNVSHTIPVITW